jgi:hypothetical protein
VPDADVLQAIVEHNAEVVEHDIDEGIGGPREQNYEGVTREAFVRRSRWLHAGLQTS